MFFLIEEALRETSGEALRNTDKQYVAVLSFEEWKQNRERFEMGIEIDPDVSEIYTTQAEVNYDSLTGSFSIPDRNCLSDGDAKFAFALDEKGVVFIDDNGRAKEIIKSIQITKRWKMPSLERFVVF